jgi:hypothetical protein
MADGFNEGTGNGALAGGHSQRQAKRLRSFYSHLTVYAVVNLVLFAIDMATPGDTWFYWPLLGWGIGVLCHANAAFRFVPIGLRA